MGFSSKATIISQISLVALTLATYVQESFMSYFMHLELFTPIRGMTEISGLPLIKDVSRVQEIGPSLTSKNFICTLVRISNMSLHPSCTMDVIHGVGVDLGQTVSVTH